MSAYSDIFGGPTYGLPDDFFGGRPGVGPGSPGYDWGPSIEDFAPTTWGLPGDYFDQPGQTSGGTSWWKDFLKNLTASAGPLAGMLGSALSGGNDSPMTTAEQRALQEEMMNMIRQQRGYMSEMDPLRQSVLRMAMGMMPIRYQTGLDYRSAAPNSGTGGRPRNGAPVVNRAVPRVNPDSPGAPVTIDTYRDAVDAYFGPAQRAQKV